MIDVVPLLFYGMICGLLAAVLPQRLALWMRVAIGAAVGICAAFFLPILRALSGV